MRAISGVARASGYGMLADHGGHTPAFAVTICAGALMLPTAWLGGPVLQRGQRPLRGDGPGGGGCRLYRHAATLTPARASRHRESAER